MFRYTLVAYDKSFTNTDYMYPKKIPDVMGIMRQSMKQKRSQTVRNLLEKKN